MVEEPGTLERVRARYGAWQEQLAQEAADPAGATVAGSRPTACGWTTCSASRRPRASCANA